jgi:alanine racemase
VTPTLGDPGAIAAWIETGAPWHLAIDTGMQRAGVSHSEIGSIIDLVRQSPPEGAFTHLHSADSDQNSLEEQQALFETAVAALPERPRYLHVENSPGIERQSPSPWDLARPGIFLYGVSTVTNSGLVAQPVAHFRARVVEIHSVQPGTGVSYGHSWRVTGSSPRRIATVNAGYADGVRRSLGNRSHGLLHGQPAPIVGVVTMDMTMLDVSDVPCEIGEVATLLGRDGDAVVDLATAARAAELSPYELLTGLRARAERRYAGP